MTGLGGDDRYQVDNAADVVIEAAGEGNDFITASISYDLPDHVEQLVLLGTGALDAITSNNSGISLIGNNGINTLTGGNGADNLQGNDGNDTLIGGLGNDVLVGGLGNDTLNGAGNGSIGAGEVDRLTGSTGVDTFVLGATSTAYYTAGGGDYANIIDFTNGQDLIQLAQLGGDIGDYSIVLNPSGTSTQIRIAATNEVIGLISNVNSGIDGADFTFS